MAITSLDGLIAAADQLKSFGKASMTAKAAGTFQSLWTAGGLPTTGIAPVATTVVVPTNATAGALTYVNPTGGALTYMSKWSNTQQTIGTLIIYDRLAHSALLNGTLATAQTVGGTAITRYTTGDDVELFLECYTATGATQVNVTCSYTNQAGTAGRTSVSTPFWASPVAGQMLPIPLQSGDTGVRSVESVTLSATTGTAGSFGVTLVKRLGESPVTIAGAGLVQDPFMCGLPQIQDSACLSFMVVTSTTSTGFLTGTINLSQG